MNRVCAAICAAICAALLTILLWPVDSMNDENRQYADTFQAMGNVSVERDDYVDAVLTPVDVEAMEAAEKERRRKLKIAIDEAMFKFEKFFGYK